MDEREILTRFKDGTLDRRQAVALLTPAVAAGPALAGGAPEMPPLPSPPHATAARDLTAAQAPVAVVGMAGRFPQAPDLAAYWRLLCTGRGAAAAPPPGRPGTEPGHYLERVADFDAEFFGLDPREAALTDPRARLLLETAWEAFEDAGCTGTRLDALRAPDGTARGVGVFVGAGEGDWPLLAAEAGAEPGGGHWDMANSVSRVLGLTGPSQCVDTAEASVPTALHLALAALERGECAAALVGGVHLLLHRWSLRPGTGEAVGALLLKPLERALADGDTVHAVVRGSAAAHAESGMLGAALERASVTEEGLGLRETAACAQPSVGRSGPATGLALLMRAVLQLRHGVLVPAPGRAVAEPWTHPDPSEPRRAVAGLRGAGGVDAQVVLEEYPPTSSQYDGSARPAGRAQLVVLSGPTPRHVKATAQRLAEWMRAGYEVPGIAAVARGLRAGRAAMDCRIAVVVHGVEELVRVLEDASCADLRGGQRDPMRLGEAAETAGYLAALWHGGRLEQLRDLWLSGVDVDWAALEAVPGAGAVSVPMPPSALLRTALWLPAR